MSSTTNKPEQEATYTGIIVQHPLMASYTWPSRKERHRFMVTVGTALKRSGIRTGHISTKAVEGYWNTYAAVVNCPESVLVAAFIHAATTTGMMLERLRHYVERQAVIAMDDAKYEVQPDKAAAVPSMWKPSSEAPETSAALQDVRRVIAALNALCDENERLKANEKRLRDELARLSASSRRAMAVFGD